MFKLIWLLWFIKYLIFFCMNLSGKIFVFEFDNGKMIVEFIVICCYFEFFQFEFNFMGVIVYEFGRIEMYNCYFEFELFLLVGKVWVNGFIVV